MSRSPKKTGKVTDSTRGAECQHFATSSGSGVGHVSTSAKGSAPTFSGSGSGGGDSVKGKGEVREQEVNNWQRLPVVEEFAQEEVSRAGSDAGFFVENKRLRG